MQSSRSLKISFTAVGEKLTYTLLFLMMFMPFEQKEFKVVLLSLISYICITTVFLTDRTPISAAVLGWILVIASIGFFFCGWGIINGFDDAFQVMPVFVIWPLAYIFIVASVKRLAALDSIYKLLAIALITISVYSIGYLLSVVGVIPRLFIFTLIQQANTTGDGAEFFSYGMPSITSLLFLIPFTFSALIIWRVDDAMPIRRFWLEIGLIISLIPVALSSSRVFWVIYLVTPLLTFIFINLVRHDRFRRSQIASENLKSIALKITFVLVIFSVIFNNELFAFIDSALSSDTFLNALTFSDQGTLIREDQKNFLIEGWLNNPIFGSGHGASLSTYRRTGVGEWAYEQTFFALLFQTGIVGVILYFVSISWIFFTGLRLCRINNRFSLYIIPALVGLVCFLIANGTNPYLYAFDHLWTLFIPLIFINVVLLNVYHYRG